jgi:hypothetical protein
MSEEEIAREKATDPQATEAETMERLQEEIRNLPVSEHLLYMMHSLSALAVGRMGTTPEDAGRRDLEQARMAIDAFKALMEIGERVWPEEGIVVHRGVLSQLQLAYLEALRAPTADGTTQAPE